MSEKKKQKQKIKQTYYLVSSEDLERMKYDAALMYMYQGSPDKAFLILSGVKLNQPT